MKKITLILALVTFAITGFAQTNSGLQDKILKQKVKNDLVIKQIKMLTNLPGISTSSTSDPLNQLKSAAKQKLDSVVSWEYDQLSKNWKYDEKMIYEYDNQMRTLGWLGNEWMEDTKAWKTEDKSEFTYGSNGELNKIISYGLDDVSGQLVREAKIEYYYKTDGKVDSILMYSEEPKETETLNVKQYYYYNASGKVMRWELWMVQDDEDEPNFGEWFKGGVFKFEYDGSGKTIKQEHYSVYDVGEMLFSQTLHKYNASGRLDSTIVSSLSFLTSMLERSSCTAYQYNAAGDVSVEIYSTWDADAVKWIEVDKYENTYGSLSASDVIYPASELLFIAITDPSITLPGKAIASDKTFEKSGENWVQTDKSTYYYSPGGTTKIDELESPSLSFYPNPASESITLKWNGRYTTLNLQVFQINGAKVLEQEIVSDEKVSISQLVKGMYLVKLLDGKQNVYTGKLVKN